jgi:hypothetical protein
MQQLCPREEEQSATLETSAGFRSLNSRDSRTWLSALLPPCQAAAAAAASRSLTRRAILMKIRSLRAARRRSWPCLRMVSDG